MPRRSHYYGVILPDFESIVASAQLRALADGEIGPGEGGGSRRRRRWNVDVRLVHGCFGHRLARLSRRRGFGGRLNRFFGRCLLHRLSP
jgi:hypothetical protein